MERRTGGVTATWTLTCGVCGRTETLQLSTPYECQVWTAAREPLANTVAKTPEIPLTRTIGPL